MEMTQNTKQDRQAGGNPATSREMLRRVKVGQAVGNGLK